MTWDEVAALPAGQVTALNAFAELGAQVQSAPAGTVIVPTRTYSNAKASNAGIASLRDLVSVTSAGANFTLAYHRKQAILAYDAANP
jgi:hypothetical protein